MNLLINSAEKEGYWYHNNELISSVPTNAIVPDRILGGNYTLEVIKDGCSFISDAFVVTDLNSGQLESDISVFPNPANDFIEIRKRDGDWVNAIVRVIDVNGKLYFTCEMKSINSKIDISDFNRGVYIVIVDNGGYSKRIRFIKL